MTIPEFTQLYNERRKASMEVGYYPIKFSITKRKTTREAVRQDRLTESGVPERITLEPKQSKQVVDTNGLTKLYQAVWEYFTGTKLKRISSEGSYRAGINGGKGGYIRNTNKGFADLHGLYNGRAYYIEVKQKKERHNPDQLKFIKWVEDGGGQYHTIRGWEEMYQLIQIIIQ